MAEERNQNQGQNQNQNSGNQGGGESGAQSKLNKININNASKEEIMRSVEGVGEETAQKIVDYRDKNGGFKEPKDLDEVRGIASTMMEKIKKQIQF